AFPEICVAALVDGVGVVRPQAQRLVEIADCLIEVALAFKRDGAVVTCAGILRSDLDGTIEIGKRQRELLVARVGDSSRLIGAREGGRLVGKPPRLDDPRAGAD